MVSQTHSISQLQLVFCQIGDERYALNLHQIRGFQRGDRLRLQASEDGQVGFLPAATANVPVYALADLLDRPRRAGADYAHVILALTGHGLWGLAVDQVSQAITARREDTRSLPPLLRLWAGIPAASMLLDRDDMLPILQARSLRPESGLADADDFAAGIAEEEVVLPAAVSGQFLLFTTTELAQGERPVSFALSAAAVGEVIERPRLASIPRLPRFVRGVTLWRNRVVPVVDLSSSFGMAPTVIDQRSRLLMVRAGELGWIGLLARPGMRMVASSVAHTACQRDLGFDASLAHGAVEFQHETVVVPNLTRVLTP